jgi:beta-glucanase (GH16 family)
MGESYQISDLRFGSFSGKGIGPDDFFFRFMINEVDEGIYRLNEVQSGPSKGKRDNLFPKLFERIMGKDLDEETQISQKIDTPELLSNNRKLIWSDEFDIDGPVDTSKWFHQTKLPYGGSWFNGEVQHYTNRMDNSYVENGNLKIVAKKETYTDQGHTKEYTSARLNSKFAFKYGRVDIRAKLPTGKGTWPAFWTLGKNISEDGAYWFTKDFGNTSWPACGEIDIMEHWGKEQNLVKSATHTPYSHGETINQGGRIISTCSSEFHTYSLDWSEERLVFMIDDVIHYVYQPDVKNRVNWPYTLEQYLLLNFAIEPIIEPSFVSDAIEIDYVRVYK